MIPPKPFNRAPLWIFGLALVFYAAVLHLGVQLSEVVGGASQFLAYFRNFDSIDSSDPGRILGLLAETVAMGFWGTLLAFVIAMALGQWATKDLTPHPAAYFVSREFLNFVRAMPDLLLAVVFVAGMGLGPLPGVLALGLHSSGFLGKVLAENMERLPKGTYEGVAACGANRLQLLVFAAWPSITREIVGYTLYTLDRNIRYAAVVGLVGAGGIGTALKTSIRTFDYPRAGLIILLTLATVVVVEQVSDQVRKRLD